MSFGFGGLGGTFGQAQISSKPTRSAPIAVFAYENAQLVLQFNGTVSIMSQTVKAVDLKTNILCGELADQTLFVGTTTGLFVLDLKTEKILKITSYSLPVPKIMFSNGMWLCSFLDTDRNNQPQYKNRDPSDSLLYTLVVINADLQVVSEAPAQCNNGQFLVLQNDIFIPQIGKLFKIQKYKLQNNQLKKDTLESFEFAASSIAQFTEDVLALESGAVHFYRTKQSVNAEGRVNAIAKHNQFTLLGLQSGEIIAIVPQTLECKVIWPGKKLEVCSMFVKDSKIVIGVGSMQQLNQPGEVLQAGIFTKGEMSIK